MPIATSFILGLVIIRDNIELPFDIAANAYQLSPHDAVEEAGPSRLEHRLTFSINSQSRTLKTCEAYTYFDIDDDPVASVCACDNQVTEPIHYTDGFNGRKFTEEYDKSDDHIVYSEDDEYEDEDEDYDDEADTPEDTSLIQISSRHEAIMGESADDFTRRFMEIGLLDEMVRFDRAELDRSERARAVSTFESMHIAIGRQFGLYRNRSQ